MRVELKGLTASDFYRILTEPTHNMIRQQQVVAGGGHPRRDTHLQVFARHTSRTHTRAHRHKHTNTRARRRCWPPRASSWRSPTTPSAQWRTRQRRPTRCWTTLGRAACTQSWVRACCSTTLLPSGHTLCSQSTTRDAGVQPIHNSRRWHAHACLDWACRNTGAGLTTPTGCRQCVALCTHVPCPHPPPTPRLMPFRARAC